jgi:hypothetical protein
VCVCGGSILTRILTGRERKRERERVPTSFRIYFGSFINVYQTLQLILSSGRTCCDRSTYRLLFHISIQRKGWAFYHLFFITAENRENGPVRIRVRIDPPHPPRVS